MRTMIGVVLAAVTIAGPSRAASAGQPAAAQAPASQPPSPSASASQGGRMQAASTMSELMVKIIYPASDAIFYITTREPKTEAEWGELQGKALAGAESPNLLMKPRRAGRRGRWVGGRGPAPDAGR